MSLTYTTTNILCAATDVGMHGLLASHRVTILCYHLVCVHCGPVVDFFITKQTSLHPFDFVRNLFHYFSISILQLIPVPAVYGVMYFSCSLADNVCCPIFFRANTISFQEA